MSQCVADCGSTAYPALVTLSSAPFLFIFLKCFHLCNFPKTVCAYSYYLFWNNSFIYQDRSRWANVCPSVHFVQSSQSSSFWLESTQTLLLEQKKQFNFSVDKVSTANLFQTICILHGLKNEPALLTRANRKSGKLFGFQNFFLVHFRY